MSARYLLPCPDCGKQIPVEGGRAGGTTVCSCSKSVDIPRMGILRTYPQEASASLPVRSAAEVSSASWGMRQGMMLLGIILLLAGGIPALYRTVTFPKAPYRTEEQIKDFADVHFDKMTVTESWQFWKTFIEPQGLTRQPNVYEAEYERVAADLRQWIMVFSAVALVGAVLLVTGFFMRGGQHRVA